MNIFLKRIIFEVDVLSPFRISDGKRETFLVTTYNKNDFLWFYLDH